ncbi:MAG: hypothetical protein HYT71_03920 [Candidatus Aenigmarchaeota archaeon]|nr:hypothetical protein [Candidatus Aenigmarchaeota archaeon]
MKEIYLNSMERLLQYERDIKDMHPPQVMGFKPSADRKMLSRSIYACYLELCDMGEKTNVEDLMAKYRQRNKPEHSLV